MNLKLWLDTVTTAFIVVGGFLALLQLRQTPKQRVRESALQMLHSFQTPEFLTAVNIVFDLREGLTKEDLEQRLGEKLTYHWLSEQVERRERLSRAEPSFRQHRVWSP